MEAPIPVFALVAPGAAQCNNLIDSINLMEFSRGFNSDLTTFSKFDGKVHFIKLPHGRNIQRKIELELSYTEIHAKTRGVKSKEDPPDESRGLGHSGFLNS